MIKKNIFINGKRLGESINKFANYGRTENNGVTRLSLTDEDIQVRNHFQAECEALGMSVVWDDLGNMYATLSGEKNGKPPVVIGSHLDSVEKGGRFDGALGVVAGLEIIRTISENNIKLNTSIIIVNITNEEGSRFEPAMMSSGILSGWFQKNIMFNSTDTSGETFSEALKKSGFEGKKENRLKEALCFLELHIEQGPVLESESLQIGVVEGVVGMVNYEITVNGDSNHAGTTPMNLRKDALFAAVDLINFIRNKIGKLDDGLVYTIGRMNLIPNIHSVIPNNVIFTIEARHWNSKIIKQVEQILQTLPRLLDEKDFSVNITKQWARDSIWFDKDVVNRVEKMTKNIGYSFKRIWSGAGHDSQFISNFIPTAMIFVPSVNGKSHSEDELTLWEDNERGANVLLQTVLEMAVD